MVIIIVTLFVVGVFALLLACVVGFMAYRYAKDMNQQAIANQKRYQREREQAEQRIRSLGALADEIRDLTGKGYARKSDKYLVSVYLEDEQPEKEAFVLATIYGKLGGRCAYREVYAAVQAFNAAALAAGEDKLRLSDHGIREIIRDYTFCKENGWPIIVIKQRKSPTERWDKIIENCVIVPTTTRGGHSRAMMPLDEVVRRLGGKAAQNDAEIDAVSAVNGRESAVNGRVRGLNDALGA